MDGKLKNRALDNYRYLGGGSRLNRGSVSQEYAQVIFITGALAINLTNIYICTHSCIMHACMPILCI